MTTPRRPAKRDKSVEVNTAEWHAYNVGLLITQLQVLEFSARVALGQMMRPGFSVEYLRTAQQGDVVPEDPMSSYDQLADILTRLNEHVARGQQLDVEAIVDLRHQLAHGRLTAAVRPPFPLTILKFGNPRRHRVPVVARVEMTAAWFRQKLDLVNQALRVVERVQVQGGAWGTQQ